MTTPTPVEPRYSDAAHWINHVAEQRPAGSDVCCITLAQIESLRLIVARPSLPAQIESLEDAIFQISVRLGIAREPDMDDMGWHTDLMARAQYLANLEANSAEAVRDGERYRWLRDACGDEWEVTCALENGMTQILNICSPDDMDRAIDAAIKEQSHD